MYIQFYVNKSNVIKKLALLKNEHFYAYDNSEW